VLCCTPVNVIEIASEFLVKRMRHPEIQSVSQAVFKARLPLSCNRFGKRHVFNLLHSLTERTQSAYKSRRKRKREGGRERKRRLPEGKLNKTKQ
jgi:hypothetical protein